MSTGENIQNNLVIKQENIKQKDIKQENNDQKNIKQENIEQEDVFQIDVRDLVHSFKPDLKLPFFIYSYLNRILHVKKLNQIHTESARKGGTIEDFLSTFVEICDFDFTITGPGYEELKQQKGQFLVASNHPYGGSEAISIMNNLISYHKDLKLVAQSFLVYLAPELKKCSVFNRNSLSSFLEAVREKKPIMIYPAGFCSRMLSNKVIFDYDWKSTFIKIVIRNKIPLYVVYVDGHVSNHVINWTRFRNFFHIKTNVELIYLIDEMIKSGGKAHKMVVSKPINPEVFTPDVSYEEWAARIRQYCYFLSKDPNLEFNPELKADFSILPLK